VRDDLSLADTMSEMRGEKVKEKKKDEEDWIPP
jgi:hypothetical protein